MGLDWIVEAKQVNGHAVEPSETTGERPATISDTETVERFRQSYELNRAGFPDPGLPPEKPPSRGGVGGLLDLLSGAARKQNRSHAYDLEAWTLKKRSFDHWSRPFDELLEENIRYARPIVPPENKDAFAAIGGAVGGFYDFRGNALRKDTNDVTLYAGEVLKMDWTDLIYLDKTPEEMLELADDLEKALSDYRGSDREQDEESIEAVEAAIPWLRFWGAKGHSIVADF